MSPAASVVFTLILGIAPSAGTELTSSVGALTTKVPEEAPDPADPNAEAASPRRLRVCADPEDLPYSNLDREGFENALAKLVARDMRVILTYHWKPNARDSARATLVGGWCDVMMGVPERLEGVLSTGPYYRSAYVFVYRRDSGLNLSSLDDPALRALRVGVRTLAHDRTEKALVESLGRRGIAHVAATAGGAPGAEGGRAAEERSGSESAEASGGAPDRSVVEPIIEDVARRRIDVAIVWGPLAEYLVRRQSAEPGSVDLTVTPIASGADAPSTSLVLGVAMAVRLEKADLRDDLDAVLRRRHQEIEELLETYHVPRLPLEEATASSAASTGTRLSFIAP
jgi:mxaJ protein